MKPIFVVLGATGAQGASVCTSLLEDKTYHVRGLTSKATSAKAIALANSGVEVVQVGTLVRIVLMSGRYSRPEQSSRGICGCPCLVSGDQQRRPQQRW